MRNSRLQFLKDFLYSSAVEIIVFARGLLIIPIITKLAGDSAYGIWAQFAITLALITVFGRLNLGFAANRFLTNSNKEDIRKDFSTILAATLVVSTIIGSLLAIFNEVISGIIFGSRSLGQYIILLAVVIVFRSISDQTLQFFRALRDIRLKSTLESIRLVSELISLAGVLLLTESVYFMMLSVVIVNIILSLVVQYLAVKRIGVTIPTFRNLNRYLRFGLPVLPMSISNWIVEVSDRYIIVFFLGLSTVSKYAVVYTLALIIYRFTNPLTNVLFPDISELRQQDKITELHLRVGKTIEYYLMVGIPSAVGLSVLAVPIVQLLSTSQIAQEADIMAVLALSMVFQGVFIINSQVINAYDQTKRVAFIWAITAILNILANYILVPILNLQGAAIATLLSSVLAAGLSIITYPGEIVITKRKVVGIVISAGLMGGLVFILKGVLTDVGIPLIVLIGVGAMSYFTILFISGVLTKEEIEAIVKPA